MSCAGASRQSTTVEFERHRDGLLDHLVGAREQRCWK